METAAGPSSGHPAEGGVLRAGDADPVAHSASATAASTTGPLLAGLKRFGFKSKALRVSKTAGSGEGEIEGGTRDGGVPVDGDGSRMWTAEGQPPRPPTRSGCAHGSDRDDGVAASSSDEASAAGQASLGVPPLDRKRRAPGTSDSGIEAGFPPLPMPTPAPIPAAFPSVIATGQSAPSGVGVPVCSPLAEPRAKRRVHCERSFQDDAPSLMSSSGALATASTRAAGSTATDARAASASMSESVLAKEAPSDAANRAPRRTEERYADENERPVPSSKLSAMELDSPALHHPWEPGMESSEPHIKLAVKPSSPPGVMVAPPGANPNKPDLHQSIESNPHNAVPRPALAPRSVPPPPMFDGRPSLASSAPPVMPAVASSMEMLSGSASAPAAAAGAKKGPPPERLSEPQRQAMEDQQWVYVHGIRSGAPSIWIMCRVKLHPNIAFKHHAKYT